MLELQSRNRASSVCVLVRKRPRIMTRTSVSSSHLCGEVRTIREEQCPLNVSIGWQSSQTEHHKQIALVYRPPIYSSKLELPP